MDKLQMTRMYPVKEHFPKYELDEAECLLKNMEASQSYTASLCKLWVKQREETIKAVEGFIKKFDRLHTACNAAHGAGTAMEVIGGVAMVAGAILTACGHKSIGEILTQKVSPVTGGVGMATAATSSLAELGLSYSTIKEVKMVLEKDAASTKRLTKNLGCTSKIDKHLRAIFNCSVLSNVFQDVITLCLEGIQLLEAGHVELSKLMAKLKLKVLKSGALSEKFDIIFQNVYETMKKILNDTEAKNTVKNICVIIRRSPSAVEFIKLGLRVAIQVCDILKVDVFTPLLGLSLFKTSIGEMATQCVFGSVVVAVNILSVISAVKNAQEGSKYSKILKEVQLALTLELNSVRNNYSKFL